MGINFGNFGSSMPRGNNDAPLNLKKNDVLDLTKRNPGLKQVVLGAGWDVSNVGSDFDIDISAFLLNKNQKVSQIPEDVIFFNNKMSQGIYLEGDNRTGFGEGDDERIQIDLSQIRDDICEIVFIVTIHEAASRRQTFGMVNNSYVRLLDAQNNDKEICRFNLKEDSSTVTSVLFAKLYKDGYDWYFKALGDGKIADLNGMLSLYM